MGAHLIDGKTFQSDKYPSCPPGKVPLSVKDPAAQPLLWEYAQRHREVDAEFSDDLEEALRLAGYVPPTADVYREVREERRAQDAKWGGPTHDDEHVERDWLDYIHGKLLAVPEHFRSRGELRGACPQPWAADYEEQTKRLAERPPHLIAAARAAYRRRLVHIAALAVAAIQSHDRQNKHGGE